METELMNAESYLRDLRDERVSLQADLAASVEAADAENLIQLSEKIKRVDVHIWAQQAKVIRLTKTEREKHRQLAIIERDALEIELQKANQDYLAALDVLAAKQLAMNQIQLKLGGLDSSISLSREEVNDRTRELREHVSRRWKTASLQPASEVAAEL
jgi:uncharacterized protein (DUF849 family)